jgi:hypothetical protein
MINIKKFKSFLENYNQGLFAPEERTMITDKDEIVKHLQQLSSITRPIFDRSPNHQNEEGQPIRLISQSEINSFVNYNMIDPVLCFSKRRQSVPDGLEFLGRRAAERKSIFDMTGIWVQIDLAEWPDWFKEFISGYRSIYIDGGVRFAHENMLNEPWLDE